MITFKKGNIIEGDISIYVSGDFIVISTKDSDNLCFINKSIFVKNGRRCSAESIVGLYTNKWYKKIHINIDKDKDLTIVNINESSVI